MKSLIVAIILFGVLCYGLYDVKSFKATLRKAARRGKAEAGRPRTGPIAEPPPAPEDPRYYEEPLTRRYR